MERRLAIAYSVSATATLGIACFAVAALSGGLFAGAAPKKATGGKSVEFIDDYIVLHSSTTLAPSDTTVLVDLGQVPAQAPSGSTHAAAATPSAAAPIAAAPAASPLPDSPAAVNVPADAPAPAPAPDDPGTPPPAAATPAPAPAPASATTVPKSTTTTPKPAPAPAPAPTTTAPRSTTTVAATGSTLPPGVRIPSDWPSGTPIPPIPPGCRQPQLEDNGVWNCQ